MKMSILNMYFTDKAVDQTYACVLIIVFNTVYRISLTIEL